MHTRKHLFGLWVAGLMLLLMGTVGGAQAATFTNDHTASNPANSNTTTLINLVGTGTAWATAHPVFTVSGLAGSSISGITWTDDTHASFTLLAGTGAANVTYTDPSTGATSAGFVGSPDTSAPVVGAASLNAAALTITVSFPNPYKAGLSPASGLTGFTATVNGANAPISTQSVSGTANDVTLVLATAVPAGQPVTVSYTPGNLTDGALNNPSNTPNAVAGFSGLKVSDARTAYTSKYILTPGAGTPSNTALGAAGNTTAVSGGIDVTGNTWNVAANLVQSVNNGNALKLSYPVSNPELNQTLVLDLPPNGWAGKRGSALLDTFVVGATSFYTQVYLNLGGNVSVYDTGQSGGASNIGTSPTITSFLNTTDTYRFSLNLQNAGSAAVFTLTVTDVSTAAPVNFNAGTNVWVLALPNRTSSVGIASLLGDSMQYSRIEYKSQFVAPVLASGVITYSQTATTLSLTAPAPTGGTGPFTYQWYLADYYDTPSNANLITGATNLSLTQTGLTPDTMYPYTLIVTDSTAATAKSIQVIPTLKTIMARSVSFVQLGDSITTGGSPRSIDTMAAQVQYLMGLPSTPPSAVYAVAGAQTSDYTNSTTLAAIASAINTAQATDVISRMGINDTRSAAMTITDLETIRAYVFANCPTVRTWWYATLTFRPYFPAIGGGGTIAAAAHTRAYQQLIAALDNGGTIRVMSPLDYDAFETQPALSSDGIHPTQAGYNLLGTLDAASWAMRTTLPPGGGTSTLRRRIN